MAPPRIILVGTSLGRGQPLLDVIDTAAALALRDLYGAAWSDNGAARTGQSGSLEG